MSNIHSKEYPLRQSEQYNNVELFKPHERRLSNLYEIAIRTEKLQHLIFEHAQVIEKLNKMQSPSLQDFNERAVPYLKRFSEYNLHPTQLYLEYSFLPDISKYTLSMLEQIMKQIPMETPEQAYKEDMVNFGKSLMHTNTYLMGTINIEALLRHTHYKVNDIKRYDEIGSVMVELIKKSLQQGSAIFGGASTTYTFPFLSRPIMLDSSQEKRTMFEVNMGLTLEENKAILEKIYENKGIITNDTGFGLIGYEMEAVNDFINNPKYFADALYVYDYYIAALANNYHDTQRVTIEYERDVAISQIKSNETISPHNKKEMISGEKRKAQKRIRLIEEKLIENIRDDILPDYTTKAIKTTYLNRIRHLVDNFKIPTYRMKEVSNLPSFN